MIWLWLLALPVSLVLLDRLAQRQSWRLGPWTQRLPLPADFVVRGRYMDLRGNWCQECGTNFRYAEPHVTFIRPADAEAGTVVGIVVLCAKCRRGMAGDVVVQRYAEWWVEKIERERERGLTPDPREFDGIKAALRTGG